MIKNHSSEPRNVLGRSQVEYNLTNSVSFGFRFVPTFHNRQIKDGMLMCAHSHNLNVFLLYKKIKSFRQNIILHPVNSKLYSHKTVDKTQYSILLGHKIKSQCYPYLSYFPWKYSLSNFMF